MANWYLGASFPVVAVMPPPNTRQKRLITFGPVNETPDGTPYLHEFGQKWMWVLGYTEITLADANTILTEYRRTRKLAMVDFDAASYTVIKDPQSFELEEVPGTYPPLYNLRISFRQVS